MFTRVGTTCYNKSAMALENLIIIGSGPAGDCAEPHHKQAIIAAGDGARAALEAQEHLRGER